MGLVAQIALGTLVLGVCLVLHVAAVASAVPRIVWLGTRWRHGPFTAVVTAATLAVVAAHTVQVWLWALSYQWLGVEPDIEAAFYLATSTYTTLGYGDVIPAKEWRVFATFAAVTGWLAFGISTAFLMSVLVRAMPDVFRMDGDGDGD